ncbi:hypothetical protein M9H77_21899 [Catharanthus roseus]|uniref:Uncharacterized protein n=1 Tax=Catharanthus roseus TaxID=4058 RepID=A0ACC0APC3_CATRO|nr:hypothetical protein M9H77_21899 [Catharanthus roseus]
MIPVSTSSRLTSFGNNASLRNLIQLHLLRPSTAQLLNRVSEQQLSSEIRSEDTKAYLKTLSIQKPLNNAAGIQFPLTMFCLSGVYQSGIVKSHTRRRIVTKQ